MGAVIDKVRLMSGGIVTIDLGDSIEMSLMIMADPEGKFRVIGPMNESAKEFEITKAGWRRLRTANLFQWRNKRR